MMLFESYRSNRERMKSYYSIDTNVDDLFSCRGNEYAKVACREYIKEHFDTGSKSDALAFEGASQYEKAGKHLHTVSLYLLGIYLEEIFENKICQKINKLIPGDGSGWYKGEGTYKYSWFLTTLYHDVYSCLEAGSDADNCCCEICQGKLKKMMEKNVRLHRYRSETVINYCRYRKREGVQDHGIIGGIQLYKKLTQMYKKKMKDHPGGYYEEKGLVWREEHLKHYVYVADAIISHNMWTTLSDNEETCGKYINNGLEELIIGPGYSGEKLSVDEYPLHFVLCFLDTIEPIKKFTSLSAYEVLNNISISYEKHREYENDKIFIRWTNVIREQDKFWDWMKSISTLSNWMDVRVSSCNCFEENCGIMIEILSKRKNEANDKYVNNKGKKSSQGKCPLISNKELLDLID